MDSTSTISSSIAPLTRPTPQPHESPSAKALISSLSLVKHIEGGYFAELDRNPWVVPNPFARVGAGFTGMDTSRLASAEPNRTAPTPLTGNNTIRNASTSIFYLLTRTTPWGCFHRNKGRTVHTLIRGRGRYVIIHADEGAVGGAQTGFKRVETFVVGHGFERGERAVWVVEGGKYKASFLVGGGEGKGKGEEEEEGGEGLLISETVIPGFEYSDHDFLTLNRFKELVPPEQVEEMKWLIRTGEKPEEKDLL
ncbi:hypothetical protein P154DRAFT_437509 [Amniculicola lignicola CBS 123094]|uniref:DUF985 domain-containing protein n=1 Tax=Amniculicola lignicola CBS 123094 TaxID=1392246 RepID=A0A6A5WEC4_9PLEO|nr:hypothetical protein P154DRAFT_437509 [Amniculicola lignicola CBS 123094]